MALVEIARSTGHSFNVVVKFRHTGRQNKLVSIWGPLRVLGHWHARVGEALGRSRVPIEIVPAFTGAF